jgi:chaperonin cofactor prefoldin
MKKLFVILCLMLPIGLFAQTDRELLLRIAEQQATVNAKIEGLQKQTEGLQKQIEGLQKQMDVRFEAVQKQSDVRFEAVDKRIDILLYVMLAILGGIFGLIGFIVWDRQASIKPLLQENKELAKEIEKMQRKEEKMEDAIKKIGQIEPRFAGILS